MLDANVPRDGGRYELGDLLGRGGMATVYAGTLRGPNGFSRKVAIKRLHSHVAGQEQLVEMLVDEARIASRLRHPNIVPVIDFIDLEGGPALVLEYVDGWSLSRLLATSGRVPPAIALGIAQGLLQGLHHVHTVRDAAGRPMNAVHRDVSPQNVLVARDGIPRLTDFGVARARGRLVHTQAGEIKGKLAYAAPELVRGEVDRRADIYAVGVLLWEMLCGVRFAEGAGLWEVGARGDAPIPRPSQLASQVPTAVDAIVLRALCGDTQLRFSSALEMADAIETRAEVASPRRIRRWAHELSREPDVDESEGPPPISRRMTIRVSHDELTTPILDQRPPETQGPATPPCPPSCVTRVLPLNTGEALMPAVETAFEPKSHNPVRLVLLVVCLCVVVTSAALGIAAALAHRQLLDLSVSPRQLLTAESRVAVRRTASARDDGRLLMVPEPSSKLTPEPKDAHGASAATRSQPAERSASLRRPRRELPGSECEPPYDEDDRGLRIYKPACVRSPRASSVSAGTGIVQPW
jgi:serine/threonine-protein kinase